MDRVWTLQRVRAPDLIENARRLDRGAFAPGANALLNFIRRFGDDHADTFPWTEWPLLIGAVRVDDTSAEWILRRRVVTGDRV